MANFIPLIRAASAIPWINWLKANGRPVTERLCSAQLGFLPPEDPNAPVPLLNVAEFMRQQSLIEGPDLGCRVVTSTSARELENLGLVALSAPTVRDSMLRVSTALPRHCTHEIITATDLAGALQVTESWMWKFDPETLHAVQQYVAALISSVCRLAVPSFAGFEMVSLVAHPEHGLSHLQPWLGPNLKAAPTPTLTMIIPVQTANAKLPGSQTQAQAAPEMPANWTKLRDGGTLSDSVCVAIEAMLPDGTPTVENLAFSAGMSVRTLQRRLLKQSTSFSELLDEVKIENALQRLSAGSVGIGELARDLGYANPSVLSRAVHRRTGKRPTAFREKGD